MPRTEPAARELDWAAAVVKSPGIDFRAPVIRRALDQGREVLDELELGWRLSRAPVLAVTGTNGKSTVAGLARRILDAAGMRVQLSGNTEFGPGLSEVASSSLDWIVCEVSSFQLEGCVSILPELAVFTNLTVEHIARHGTLDRYGEIKRRLFFNDGVSVPRAIVDVDGQFGRRLADDIERCGGCVTRVGFSEEADYRVERAVWDLRRAQTQVTARGQRISLSSVLPGAYNARNLVSALAIADLTGVERRISLAAIGSYVGPPGRFEHIDAGQPFELIVDFAHTPDGIEQMLGAIRAGMEPRGTLRVVFGLGGAPGFTLEEMGRLARRLSDQLILTTSGFRGRPRLPALGSLLAGARTTAGGELEVILDRYDAIRQAVRGAGPDDVIVIPGRGALPTMRADPHGEPVAFDDRVVAREIVRERLGSGSSTGSGRASMGR